ncbi:Patatin [Segetibacter sp. 3557_3]|uniref:patatin-like phospholipase family protein n=1 Tax=Segetibacter sp. 3557_3 TaxID=2547429 RepID=UPI0010589F8B|nr:patatin-like phospholipase family protein [Segetibacter sp. 3557_3]TDH25243.1 Patatin [Segetibacter sp. 3557_3]
MAKTTGLSVERFTEHQAVQECIRKLENKFGQGGKNLIISDVLDTDGHQYVDLVQKGGGVLAIALVGYTYILEAMGIRFIRHAGTSAGAINAALMAVIGSNPATGEELSLTGRTIKGNKKIAKSNLILKAICELNFFDFVDGHPVARWLIRKFISHKDFTAKLASWITGGIFILIALPVIDLFLFGLHHQLAWASRLLQFFFLLTGFAYVTATILIFYFRFLLKRLKDSGFGINPGDYLYNWVEAQMKEHHVHTVSDLVSAASTPVPDLYLRADHPEKTRGLQGDVTFIASELVTQNKIEFPKMWPLFARHIDQLQPAGFVRASMSIPLFFESYFINNIPCDEPQVKKAWQALGTTEPPCIARFVDGGILSNFPINIFYNPNVTIPRLPSIGIDLDDALAPEKVLDQPVNPNLEAKNQTGMVVDDTSTNALNWSLGGYLLRMFNTIRFYYDKDFLIKNAFFKKGIGTIPLKGFGWLNFFLSDEDKIEMFVLGAKAAEKFLDAFDWEQYKQERVVMKQELEAAKT